MDLVVHQVMQLQHVDVANTDRLRKRLTGTTVEEIGLAVGIH